MTLIFDEKPLVSKLNHQKPEKKYYSVNEEPAQLALKIFDTFKKDVEKKGSKFIVAHMPRSTDIHTLMDGEALAYSEMLEIIEKDNHLIRTEAELLEEAKRSSVRALFIGHFSQKANMIVADKIAGFILENYKNNLL